MVSGGITVRCRHVHTTAHGKGDVFCLVVLTCGQGEIAGRPTVKHFAIGHCGLVQRHGHCCAVRYIVGLFAGGWVSVAVQLAGHIAAVVFHSNSAAGHGQRVEVQSFGVELPTGIERDAIDVCKQLCIRISVLAGCIGIPTCKDVALFGRCAKRRNVCAVVNFFRLALVTIYESHINGGNKAFVPVEVP